MKSWVLRNQFEAHIDNIEVSGDKITILLHAHFDEPRTTIQDKKQLMGVRELDRKRVLITLSEFVSIKGLNESKSDLLIPSEKGGDGAKVQA